MERIRVGNDIKIRWALFDSTKEAYDLTGKDIAIEIVVRQMTRIRISDFTVDGNTVSFVFAGKDQTCAGRCDLKIVENDGAEEMMTFDVKGAFELVPHSWLAAGEEEGAEVPECDSVKASSVSVTSSVQTARGPQGEPGPPGEPGPKGDKGDKGDTGPKGDAPELSADDSGKVYSGGELLSDAIPRAARLALLRVAPQMTIRSGVISVTHPLLGEDGAEIVLMRYNRKCRKTRIEGGKKEHRFPKRGYCIATGAKAGSHYCEIRNGMQVKEVIGYLNEHGIVGKRHFGIALRVPNPDYNGPESMQRNATYKGVPESLWSNVLRLGVGNNGNGEKAVGLGIL